MRSIRINFTATEKLPDGNVLGYKGENEATTLIITPPAEMAANESISYYLISFQVGAHLVFYSDQINKGSQLSYAIEQGATMANTVNLQLEGYSRDSNLIMKSDIIEGLLFKDSNCGNIAELTSEAQMISRMLKAIANTHTHDNKRVLDVLALTENNVLAVEGNPIREEKTIEIVADDNISIDISCWDDNDKALIQVWFENDSSVIDSLMKGYIIKEIESITYESGEELTLLDDETIYNIKLNSWPQKTFSGEAAVIAEIYGESSEGIIMKRAKDAVLMPTKIKLKVIGGAI